MLAPPISGAALPEATLDALHRGDSASAYYFADRWIRLGGANASNLLLRAEAANRLGLNAAARQDIRRGLTEAPLHRLLNRRCLEWGEGGERIDAARALVSLSPLDAEVGLKALADAGECGAGVVRVEDGFAIGWLAWRSGSEARLEVPGRKPSRQLLQGDPAHPYSRIFGAALSFRISCEGEPSSLVCLSVEGRCVAKARIPGERRWPDEPSIVDPDTAVTVLVPVYDDYEATRDCLISVALEVEATPSAIALAIDDGSPCPRIRGLLACFSDWPGCRVVRNPGNLGFVAAVNRGLKRLPHGDVLLLNADARLPYGALARLMREAKAQPRVGIVNPLSNHGEFVSYPRPFQHNAFDPAQWRTIDRAAARSGEGELIDIPSATGFCSYITRNCLDAIGGLSGEFADGYLEDADFGLRAREAGFRNVCAVSVYVPHIGSRSFKSAKAALVARNRMTLARRFPDYERECSAYLEADPLARSRANLETALAAESPTRRLIVGPARWREAMRRRAEELAAAGVGAVIGHIEADRMSLRGHGGAAPQNVEVGLAGLHVADALARWRFDRIEWFWTADAPAPLARVLERGNRPLDLIIAYVPRSARDCAWPRHETLYVTDFMTERACALLGRPAERLAPVPAAGVAANGVDLAILYPFETASSRRFLLSFSLRLKASGRQALLIGAIGGEERLLAEGMRVTGPAPCADWPRLFEVHAPRRLLLPYRDQGFWASEEARRWTSAPAAYFDLTRSRPRLGPSDLPLDAGGEEGELSAAVLDWTLHDGAQPLAKPERAAA